MAALSREMSNGIHRDKSHREVGEKLINVIITNKRVQPNVHVTLKLDKETHEKLLDVLFNRD